MKGRHSPRVTPLFILVESKTRILETRLVFDYTSQRVVERVQL